MRRSGFTLVELMITVAIIGLLASFAIPSFIRFQLRSKSTEAVVNLSGIARAQTAYFAEYSSYVSVVTPVPDTPPGSVRMPWPGASDFGALGWAPEGAVLFQYMVSTAGGLLGGAPQYTAEAAGNLDVDADPSFFGFVKPPLTGGPGLDGAFPGTTCLGNGVFDASSGGINATETPGPCDPLSGRSVF